MGGKKKGLSNRLAKMSDEERARYLQHRAAIEEEAKRRKEQLITTYIKNKLKREDAFTRLNIAKINEHWHQILRKIKVKELRIKIEDLSSWITKIIDIKNSIIAKLMEEIQEAEEQYERNLESHLLHIDNFIDMHFLRQNYLQENFEKHKEAVLKDTHEERDRLIDRANKEETHLKTVLFTMEKNFNDIQKELKTFRDSKLQDYSNSLKASQETMVKSYSMTMDKIWRDINTTLREYLNRTTVRRHHYIELKHLDDRNTAERLHNERRIATYTETITTLKSEYESLHETNETQIKDLTELKLLLSNRFRQLKQSLTVAIRRDEKLLRNMTVMSNAAIKDFERTLEKGNRIQNMVTCCRRLETEDEKLICWAKLHEKFDKLEDSLKEESSEKVDSKTEEDTSAVSFSEDTKEEVILQTLSESVENEDLPPEFEVLKKLDGLWWCCNRAAIECMRMKREKEDLILENKSMKEIIKNILKDAALATPISDTGNFPVEYQIKSAPAAFLRQSSRLSSALSYTVVDL